MRKVTKEEADSMLFTSEGKSYVRLVVEQMKPGEILHIEKDECENKRGPFESVSRATTGKKRFSIKTIYGGGGWLIERIN